MSDPRLLTVKQVCAELGLTDSMVYRLIADGRLRVEAPKTGKRKLVARSVLDAFIAQHPDLPTNRPVPPPGAPKT